MTNILSLNGFKTAAGITMTTHGRWRLEKVGNNVLAAQAYDGWNSNAIKDFLADFKILLKQMPANEKWVYISDTREWGLTTPLEPEDTEELKALYQNAPGIACDVIILDSALHQGIIQHLRKTASINYMFEQYFADSVAGAIDIAKQYITIDDETALTNWFASKNRTMETDDG